MYPAKDARELAILLRISRELDVVGDITATVDNPSELLAWALVLDDPEIVAWRAGDSGHRYLHVTARRSRAPVRGCITAVLHCDHHEEFWNASGWTNWRPAVADSSAPRTSPRRGSSCPSTRPPPRPSLETPTTHRRRPAANRRSSTCTV